MKKLKIKIHERRNDVHGEKFISRMDKYFTSDRKQFDHWTRRNPIKLTERQP